MTNDELVLAPSDVLARAESLRATGETLRAMEDARVVRAIADVARLLADPDSPLGAELVDAARDTTGLSPAMVAWGLRTTLVEASESALERALVALRTARGPRRRLAPRGLAAVVLSGNVFTASFRALAWPLLFRVPTIAKASSRDDVLATFFRRALEEVDAELSRSLDVVTFTSDEDALLDALVARADVASVYGSDHTIASIRARLPASTALLPHGHGLGVAYVPKGALVDEASVRRTLEALALDVAAYDQRGCLSPHAIFVEPGGVTTPRELAHALARELERLALVLPRAALSLASGALELQWRGVAIARGVLHEGNGYAVSYEGDDAMRLSPGHRNVQVLAASLDELVPRIAPLGVHLKALGVAGGPEERERVLDTLPAMLAPRVSAAGTMQTPPFDASADGELPFTGFVRFVDAE